MKSLSICWNVYFLLLMLLSQVAAAVEVKSFCSMTEEERFWNTNIKPGTSFMGQVEAHYQIYRNLVKTVEEQVGLKEEARKSRSQPAFDNAYSCISLVEWNLDMYLASAAVADVKIAEGYLFEPTKIIDGPPAVGEICGPNGCAEIDPILAIFFMMAGKVVDCLNNNTCPDPKDMPDTNNDFVKFARSTYPINPGWWIGALIAGDDNGEVGRLLRDPAGRIIEIRDNWIKHVDSDCSGEGCRFLKNPGKRTLEIGKNYDREIRKARKKLLGF